ELAPEIWPPLRQAIERGAPSEEVLTFREPLGAERSLTCRLDPIARDGRPIGSAIVLTEGSGGGERARGRRAAAHATGQTSRYAFTDFIGDSAALRQVLSLARAAARHTKPILIVGESGTGKELVAHAIHGESRRAEWPFVAVN